MACYEACRGGVKRAHLVDARLDGGILLELYSRDGVGTMISTDFYEGIRKAGPFDTTFIKVSLAISSICVVANASVRSSQKSFIVIIKNNAYSIKVSEIPQV